MLEIPRRPAKARFADLVARGMRLWGVDKSPITPEDAQGRAAEACGLDDFDGDLDDDYRTGLDVFCRSARDEGGMDVVGREIMRAALRRVLVNRLLLIEERKRRPEVFTAALRPPLIIIGLPRTGSTFLQRLLATDPASFAPATWQMWHPLPIPNAPDKRRAAVVRAIEGIRTLTPQLDAKHYLDADRTEECFHLRDPSFRGPGLVHMCLARGFSRWLQDQDVRPSYAMYAHFLHVFQDQAPGRRLVLKAPTHTSYVEEILEHVPNALFVQTHRDPVEIVPSILSLAHTMFALTSPKVPVDAIREDILELLRFLVERNAEQRARLAPAIVDVPYSELVADPLATVRRIYRELRIELTPEAEAAMLEQVGSRPKDEHGRHAYDLADFGLTPAEVREQIGVFTEPYLS